MEVHPFFLCNSDGSIAFTLSAAMPLSMTAAEKVHTNSENISMTKTPEKRLPTPDQRRLVNIGMAIQFHLAALGHLAVWLWMLYGLLHPTIPEDWTYEEWYREGGFITEIFVYQGIPFSFGVLVVVYILFRLLLAFADFAAALATMIKLNVVHASVLGFAALVSGAPLFGVTPLRLAIPIVLYSMAYYRYSVPQSEAANDESSDVS